jgi:GNAT superfamily N-acetyltransferase
MEGYKEMVKKSTAKASPDAFVKVLIGVVHSFPKNGILIAQSDEGELLGYGVGFEDNPVYENKKGFLLYALYSRSYAGMKVPEALLEECEKHAKEQGFNYLHALSGRFSGSAISFYTERLKMQKTAIYYTKEI